MNYIISVDCGTTASKICLFNEDGVVIGSSTQEYQLLTPSALEVEIGADTLWTAFKTGVSEVLTQTKVNPKDITALGISAQGETLIPIDKNGAPLRNAISWMDNRAQEEAEILDKEFDDGTSYRITGQVKIVPTWPASKIFWLKRHEPKTFEKVFKYLLTEDYLIYKMTGQFVCEGSLICSTAYWNIIAEIWWDEMLAYLGVSQEQLPEVRFSGEAVGEIEASAASELGLSQRTVVSMGALDQVAGAIGVGNIKPGMFSENTGAALAICAPVKEPVFDPQRKMPIHYFGIPHTYMAHTFTTGGMVLRWYRDNFCQQEMNVASLTDLSGYYLLDHEAERIQPGCEGLVMLPHLQGAMAPEADPKAKGVFYGFTLRHTKGHFVRAIMEAVACIVRRNIDVLKDLKIEVKEIRALGGGARSRLWNQIKADLIHIPLVTTKVQEEAACLGAAILAGKAVGAFKSVDEACGRMISMKERFEPNTANFKAYDEAYQRYVKLYDSLKGMFAEEPSTS